LPESRPDAATEKTLWLSEGRQGDNASLVAAGGEGGAAFKVLRRYTVAETPTRAHLAVVGDILVKDAGSLAYLRF